MECAPGTVEVCDYNGNIITSLDPKDPPEYRASVEDLEVARLMVGRMHRGSRTFREVCDGLDNCNAAVDDVSRTTPIVGFVEGADYGVYLYTRRKM